MKKNRLLVGTVLIIALMVIFLFFKQIDNGRHQTVEDREPLYPSRVLEPTLTGSSLPDEATDKSPPAQDQSAIIRNENRVADSGGNSEERRVKPSKEELAKVLRYHLNKQFEEEAKETLPLLEIYTNDPTNPERPRPREGEIWIRIRPHRSRETRDIMAQVADLYRKGTWYNKSVTVVLWVGGQPWARFQYPLPGEENEDRSERIEGREG